MPMVSGGGGGAGGGTTVLPCTAPPRFPPSMEVSSTACEGP
nr:unnamed protein product [Callosobruchus analis]